MILPASAGVYEDAFKHNDRVAVYFYAPTCPTCKDFDYYWKEISKRYKADYKLIKVNAHTPYGNKLWKQFGLYYVPNIILADKKNYRIENVEWACMSNYRCLEYSFAKFAGK